MNREAVGKGYQQWRGEAIGKRDHKLLNILDRGWELNVIKQTMNALNTGNVSGIYNTDFAKELAEFLKQRSGSMNKIAVAKELVEIAKLLTGTTGTFECPNCGTKVLKNTGYCVKCEKKVKEAAETFECPNCGSKVLKNTGYCLKCKEKVKQAAKWTSLPRGWTEASLGSFFKSLAGAGDAKAKFYRCVDKIGDSDVSNPNAFCGALLDRFMDPSWRGVGR